MTARIGRIFADICKGFGMRVLAYDAFPNPATGLEYVTLDRLLAESDIVSLHCPLLPETKHMVNADSLAMTGDGGRPYCVYVNPFYDEESGRLYFHGGKVGHKVDSVRRDSVAT